MKKLSKKVKFCIRKYSLNAKGSCRRGIEEQKKDI